jgi:hypothetical protein
LYVGPTYTELDAINDNAETLQATINGVDDANLPTIVSGLTSSNASLTPEHCTFTGYIYEVTLNVTDNGTCAGGPPIGAWVCDGTFYGGNCTGGNISNQETLITSASYDNNNTTVNYYNTANLETFSMFLRQTPITSKEMMTAYWEELSVSSGYTGTLAAGQQLQDAGGRLTTNYCVIWSGSGSTWIVACLDPTSIWTPPSGGWTTTLCDIEAIGKIPTSGSPGHAYV